MVGAHLVERLLRERCAVWLLLHTPDALGPRLAAHRRRVQTVVADLTDLAAVQAAVQQAQPDLVFHLAGTRFNPPPPEPGIHFRVTLLGTLHLLEALRPWAGARLVFTSSAAEYGSGTRLTEASALRPATLLGASKAAATLLLQTYARLAPARASVILRVFTPYGPGEAAGRVIPHTILSALQGAEVRLSAGDQQRDFFYVTDLVEALWLAAQAPVPPGSVFNIGSGIGRPVREVAALILRLMGDPVGLHLGALPTRSDEIMEMSGDIQAARAQLGWQPRIPLEAGLQRTIQWITDHHALARELR